MSYYKLNTEEIELFNTYLPILAKRFKHFVTETQILNWILNFERKDFKNALELLKYVNHYDDREIIEGYDYCINKVLNQISNSKKIIVIPSGEFGKSGTAMVYYFRKTQVYETNKGRFILLSNHKQLKGHLKKDFVIILLDDYFGSGDSAIKFYNHAIGHQVSKLKSIPNIFLVSIVAQIKAKIKLEKNICNCKVESFNEMDKAFSKKSSPFGRREKMVGIREFCHEYGSKLYKDHPLGYENSQALVSFSYGSPNNTVPVLWASAKNWTPLFPRFFQDKVRISREFRKESARILSILKTMGESSNILFNSSKQQVKLSNYKINTFNKIDFQLFCIIRLKKMKRPKHIICQILGINTADYDTILNEAEKRGLVDSNGNLTNFAEGIYNEVNRKIREYHFGVKKNKLIGNSLYVPTSFRGIS